VAVLLQPVISMLKIFFAYSCCLYMVFSVTNKHQVLYIWTV